MITPYLPNSNLTPDIEKMLKVWTRIQPETSQPSALSNLDPDEIVSSIFAMGPFYYYVITFTDMSVGEISANFGKLHGIRPSEVRHISDVLSLIHPDDMDFVVKAEERALAFIGSLSLEKALRYKASYNHRFRTADGGYRLFNHQALVLSMDESKRIIKSINIHTDISHITTQNNHKWSAIGLAGEPSYLNMDVWELAEDDFTTKSLSKRELDVVRLIAKGLTTNQIADSLSISADTVKVHRKNILQKSGCANMAELAARSISEGWV